MGGDTEFARRAARAGFRLFYSPRMAARHRVTADRLTLHYLSDISRGRGRTRVALAQLQGQPSNSTLLRNGLAQTFLGLDP